jgi:hypothetical protein
MASKRKYAYYLKGNKLAVIEENTGSGVCSLSGYSNQTTCEAAGGTWTENAFADQDNEYKSPVADITDGIELQYAYSPTYRLPDTSSHTGTAANWHKFYMNGWTVVDGYLTFIRTETDWTSLTKVAVDSYIYIDGSSRWNGIHKVQERQDDGDVVHGGVKTYTKVPEGVRLLYASSATWGTNDYITGLNNGAVISTLVNAETTPYVWISGSDAAAKNNGLFGGWSDPPNASSFNLLGGTRYTINTVTHTEDPETDSATREETATVDFAADSSEDVYIYEAFREPGMTMTAGVDVLDDTDFDLDLNRYQAKAVVYYLKAQVAEEGGDMQQREYFLREFKKQLEKASGAFKDGSYIAQGFKQMR